MNQPRVSYVELFWDCPECGEPHISAVFNPNGQRCPSCFYWRQDDDHLYEAPDSQVITDPALINRPPHWICKVCEATNLDTGLPAELLQCGNCDSYQVSQVGEITGNEAEDRQAPATDAAAEVELRSQIPASRYENPTVPKSLLEAKAAARTGRWPRCLVALVGLGLSFGGITIGGIVWLLQPQVLEVQVRDLTWTVTTPIEQFRPVERANWDEQVPAAATVLRQEIRVRDHRREQRGTRTETYSTTERYDTGRTEERCTTVSQGNGIGQKRCTTTPVYASRSVERTRTVPVYVEIPIEDTWVTYRVMDWVAAPPLVQSGQDDTPRPTGAVTLPTAAYQQRQLPSTTECKVTGIPVGPSTPAPRQWSIDCAEYDLLEPAMTVKLSVPRFGPVRLLSSPQAEQSRSGLPARTRYAKKLNFAYA